MLPRGFARHVPAVRVSWPAAGRAGLRAAVATLQALALAPVRTRLISEMPPRVVLFSKILHPPS
eukprot:scaffold1151_cov126-Isochrysis_galbana.AAC.18